jgi:surface antigen
MNDSVSGVLVGLCVLLVGIVALTVIFQLTMVQTNGVGSPYGLSVTSDSPNIVPRSATHTLQRVGAVVNSVTRPVERNVTTFMSSVGRISRGGAHSFAHAGMAGIRFIGSTISGGVSWYIASLGVNASFTDMSVAVGSQYGALSLLRMGQTISGPAVFSAILQPANSSPVPTISSPITATVAAQPVVSTPAAPAVTPAPVYMKYPAVVASGSVPVSSAKPQTSLKQAINGSGASSTADPAPTGVVVLSGFTFPGDEYAPGNCTYWAYARRAQVGESIPNSWGDASSWSFNATLDGYKVDHVPTQYAIMQTSEVDDGLGHVAFVEGVDPDGTWHISEMNVLGLNTVDHKALPASAAANYNFIHTKE